MNLNESIRSAFIQSALNDVPQVDYDEQARSLALKSCIAALPPEVRALYLDTKTSEYIKVKGQYIGTPNQRYSMSYAVPGPGLEDGPSKAQCVALLVLAEEQKAKLRKLEETLYGVVKSARTRKQLAAMLPEFEKYLPADQEAANRSVPCIANVLTDFVKAGWPKKVPKAKVTKTVATFDAAGALAA